MSDKTPAPAPVKVKKDFWAPFRTDFKTFVGKTRKASAAGIAAGGAAFGSALGGEIMAAGSAHTTYDFAANLGGLALIFVGGFVAGFAAAYSTTNA